MSHERIVLLVGLGPTARAAVESLALKLKVAAIVRTADDDDEVVELATHMGISIVRDSSVAAVESAIAHWRPDCVVVSSFNRVFPSSTLKLCPFVNVHYAPLPRYRGRATVNWAIINHEPSTAVTIHRMEPGLDAGDVLFQQQVAIGPDETVTSLYERLNDLQREHLGATVQRFLDGDPGTPQRSEIATYCCTRIPEDGEIDWRTATRDTYALIRALAPPFPGAFTYLDGEPLIVWKAQPLTDAPRYVGRIPGRVVFVSRGEGYVDVLAGDGVLRIHEVQLRSRPVQPPAELIRSVRITLGLRAADLLGRIRQLEERFARLQALETI